MDIFDFEGFDSPFSKGSGWNNDDSDDSDGDGEKDKGNKSHKRNPNGREASHILVLQDSLSKSGERIGKKKRKKTDGNGRSISFDSSLKEGDHGCLRVLEESHPNTSRYRRPPFPQDLNHDSPMLNLDKENPSDLLVVARNAIVDDFIMQKYLFHQINEINVVIWGVKNNLENLKDSNPN